MGGNPDKSGSINTNVLIEVLKFEFKMTIDIEVNDNYHHLPIHIAFRNSLETLMKTNLGR